MISSLLFFVLTVNSIILIVLVLIQRGRGGGLVGALGGSGSTSAFGARTGDVFTKITIYTALIWGLLCMILVGANNRSKSGFAGMTGSTPAPVSSSSKDGAKPTDSLPITDSKEKSGATKPDSGLPPALEDEKL